MSSSYESKEQARAHKKALAETWSEMQALESETENLLKSCQLQGGDASGSKKKNMKTGNAKDMFGQSGKKTLTSKDDGKMGKSTKGKGKKGKMGSSQKGESLNRTQAQAMLQTKVNPMSLSLDGGLFDKTRDLYNESLGRVTVEVLDDASPDGTPRGEEETKMRDDRLRQLAETQGTLNEMQETEAIYRKSEFSLEKTRILQNNDVFVSAPGVSANDVEQERKRLANMEAAARRKKKEIEQEVGNRAEYLERDRTAILIQKTYRGHIGKRKFRLSHRLKQIEKKDEAELVWIEVRDKESGDVWYYNKSTGLSQWDKPNDMFSVIAPKENVKRIPGEQGGDYGGEGETKSNNANNTLRVNMNLPSHQATAQGKKALTLEEKKKIRAKEESIQEAARDEVSHLIGVDKLQPKTRMSGPDGSFKPQLRTTVLDALLETRFDSVSTVLSDHRWLEANKNPFQKPPAVSGGADASVDRGKKAMVSMMKIGQADTSKRIMVKAEDDGGAYDELMAADLTVRDVKHPGFTEEEASKAEGPNGQFIPGTMCFGCWSSGAKRKCSLHDGGDMLKPSQTMLLCRNWELGVMRRRYRSEEIQEIFMKKGSSLRYDVKRKAFLTVVEQRHQIYRGLKNLIEKFNFRMLLWMKIKRWLNSLADEVRSKPVSKQSKERVALMRQRRTLTHAYQLTNVLNEFIDLIALPPTTGTSWPERIGEIQFLYKRADQASGMEVELIVAYPTPPNKTLYNPREYHIAVPKSIPMPKPAYQDDKVKDVLPANEFLPEHGGASWLEKMIRSISTSVVFDAMDQVETITPVSGLELIKRTKQPDPSSIKFASMGKKPTPGNLAVGGLPAELLVYQLISTYVPPQYGSLLVMDKSTVSPGVSPEVLIAFHSLLCAPMNQPYTMRQLEHPLNYRRAPTITANSAVDPDNRHYYGTNRPDQTGEQASHGFRTTAWAKYVVVAEKVNAQVFTPGNEVVSLNTPASNRSVTTHADHTYPFCEPSTRDNSTLDFFHLLLQGAISGSKAQVFTALTVQEPGLFLRECDIDQPLGHLVVSIYRSWAFTQKDTIEEFKTDDGVSYWYHRRTGQTFWERPLYEEEEKTSLEGGTVLDMEHSEEPLNVHKGQEGADRRYNQGEFRQLMLSHHESDAEAEKRRRTAQIASRVARDRGLIPDCPPGQENQVAAYMKNKESLDGNPGDSVDLQSQGLGVTFPNEGSMEAHSAGSGSQVSGSPSRQGGSPSKSGGGSRSDTRLGSALDEGSMVEGSMAKSQGGGSQVSMGGGSMVSGGARKPPTREKSAREQAADQQIQIPGMPGQALAGVAPDMLANLTQNLQAMMGQMGQMATDAKPQDMLQLGMGMGMALLGSGAVQNMTTMGDTIDLKATAAKKMSSKYNSGAGGDEGGEESGFFPQMSEEAMLEEMANKPDTSEDDARNKISHNVRTGPPPGAPPIGEVNPTEHFSTDKILDKDETDKQEREKKALLSNPLTALEYARGLRVEQDMTETPDIAPEKVLTTELPKNAEEGAKDKGVVCMVYPELSTMVSENGPPDEVDTHPAAGLGTSFVKAEDADNQLRVQGSDVLRKTVVPLPVGFFNAIISKHIAKQNVDYLPMVPNLPQARTVGRVKPRSSAIDWLAISFDPWSAGKNPLNSEFIPSLSAKADGLFGKDKDAATAQDELDRLRDTTSDAFVTIDDKEGQAEQRAVITKDQLLAADFERVCSLCRHSKFGEVEQLVNQPDWNVPVDYQNDMGNTLLHVVAQNGNKRLVKLCLRRGMDLNVQNLTGQTALHFAFGYGYDEVGDYIVKKGADDSIKNKDGLTCYEGLGAAELNLL